MNEEVVENVEVTEEIVEDVIEEEVIPTEDTEEVQEETEESEDSELEDWMRDDSQEDKEEKPTKFLKAKKKLKGELKQKNDELEALKAEIEALKNKPTQSKPNELKRPDPLDFESDEEYNLALDDYTIKLFEARQKQDQSAQQQQKVMERIQADADAHYERAAKLMEESGISVEKYKAADTKLREAIEAVFPQRGDVYTDMLLGSCGEGSEKVGYYIGNNESARLKFQELLREDPNGIKAAMYLGEQKQRLSNTNTKKVRSKAKPPAPNPTGDSNSNSSEAVLRKKYKEAHKKGDGQNAFNIKREARKSGIDVSNW